MNRTRSKGPLVNFVRGPTKQNIGHWIYNTLYCEVNKMSDNKNTNEDSHRTNHEGQTVPEATWMTNWSDWGTVFVGWNRCPKSEVWTTMRDSRTKRLTMWGLYSLWGSTRSSPAARWYSGTTECLVRIFEKQIIHQYERSGSLTRKISYCSYQGTILEIYHSHPQIIWIITRTKLFNSRGWLCRGSFTHLCSNKMFGYHLAKNSSEPIIQRWYCAVRKLILEHPFVKRHRAHVLHDMSCSI